MKTIFLLLVVAPFFVHAQASSMDSVKRVFFKTGAELRKYAWLQNTGFVLEGGGAAAIILGATVNNSNDNNRPVILIGTAVSLIGIILQGIAATHINRAGLILQQNGIAIALDRKTVIKMHNF